MFTSYVVDKSDVTLSEGNGSSYRLRLLIVTRPGVVTTQLDGIVMRVWSL
jgi:hypothetical protein